MNTIHAHRLLKVVPSALELQLSISWWAHCYAEAGEQSQLAWQMHSDAVDNGQPVALVEQLRETARIFDAIRCDAWHQWELAKQALLALTN